MKVEQVEKHKSTHIQPVNLTDYSELHAHIPAECEVPAGFFQAGKEKCSCIFLVSCLSEKSILWLEDTFEEVTGYSPSFFIEGGLTAWYKLVHPNDMRSVSENIKRSFADFEKPGSPKPFPPLILEYRFKGQNGKWTKIRDIKYLLLEGESKIVDKGLCKFERVTERKESDESCYKLLNFALSYDKKMEQFIKSHSLSNREIEILSLIGKGLSTKMIAYQCNISINTVETHRRHLLEKFKVKNSMELIKEASKIISLE